MAAATFFNIENVLPFLYYWIRPHQIWWKFRESDIKRNCQIKNAHLVMFKMVTAAILKFENRLPFLYYLTNPHQIWWDGWEFDKERNCHIKNALVPKFEMATAAISNFENRLPFPNNWTNPHQSWSKCWESDRERNLRSKMYIYSNSKWRPPPSWISKMCCHLFTIGPILIKFDGNVENLT